MSKPLHQALVECVGERKYGRVWEGVEQSKLYHLLRDHKLLKEAGVPFTRPFHDFRKTVKHRLKIEKGLGREISKGFMGHKTDAMDDYYTHLKMFDLWSAVKDSWKQ
jgi:integrase